MPRTPQPPELSEISQQWLASNPVESRKALGQYLTPASVAGALLDRLTARPGMRVLDPGVGTGELLYAVRERWPEAELTGWDVDRTALEAAARLVPEAELVRRSALERPAEDGGFDLVVGNPPYFQLRPNPDQKERFGQVISGRANIFAFFFKAGLDALRPGGTLAYIVPPSMNSGAYFERLREHLIERATITSLTVLDGADRFEGVNTAVQLLILEKRERHSVTGEPATGKATGADGGEHPGEPFVFERNSPGAGFRRIVFTPDPVALARQFEGRRTLWELGFEAATGTVVWNQHREQLRDSPGPGTVPLIWSRDLGAGGRQGAAGSPGKPRFVTGCEPRYGPAILVNRVVGAVGRGELRTAFVEEGEPYLAENHVNVIRPRSDRDRPPAVGWERLGAALAAPQVAERVRLLTGNTQISAGELTHLLPLA